MAQTQPQGQADHAGGDGHQDKNFWSLVLGSIGVVYGDIGTSPLYAFKEAIGAAKSRRHRPRARDRRAVADPLGAVPDRHAEVRDPTAARRQQGRGRHVRADGARPVGRQAQRSAAAGAWHRWRVVLLRRCRHHAGDLGAVGRRRPEARHAGAGEVVLPIVAHHPGRAVLRAIARHRKGGRRSLDR